MLDSTAGLSFRAQVTAITTMSVISGLIPYPAAQMVPLAHPLYVPVSSRCWVGS